MAQDLGTIDIIITSIMAVSVLIGFFRGAIKEVFTVVSWAGSIFLTILLFPLSKNIISNFIQQPLLVDLIAYIVLFVLFLIVLSTLTYLFSSIVKNSVLAVPNKICGILFGILRGILILAVLDFVIGQYVMQDYNEYVKDSKLRPYVKDTSKMIFIMLPDNIRQALLKHLSLEQQKELLNRFDLNNTDNNKPILAKQDDNISTTSNVQSNNTSEENKSNSSIMISSNNKSNNNVKKGQTATELSELKVKESNPSSFYKDTKKDLDKLLDAYT